jgi:hypothetical protein
LGGLLVGSARGIEAVAAIEFASPKHQRPVFRGKHMLRRVTRENGD